MNDEYKKKYDELDKNICNDNEFVNSLITQKFLISNDYDEKKIVDASRYRRAYGEKSAYIRILTTTSCNARCSYCYEKGFKTEFKYSFENSEFVFISSCRSGVFAEKVCSVLIFTTGFFFCIFF